MYAVGLHRPWGDGLDDLIGLFYSNFYEKTFLCCQSFWDKPHPVVKLLVWAILIVPYEKACQSQIAILHKVGWHQQHLLNEQHSIHFLISRG